MEYSNLSTFELSKSDELLVFVHPEYNTISLHTFKGEHQFCVCLTACDAHINALRRATDALESLQQARITAHENEQAAEAARIAEEADRQHEERDAAATYDLYPWSA